MEVLTPKQAKDIFVFHGATDDVFNDHNSLKKFRNDFVRQHHPDITGGNDDSVKEMNAAYDVLKKNLNIMHAFWNALRDEPEEKDPYSERTNPEWQTNRYSNNRDEIFKNDFTDLNYVKKYTWEKSGHSKKRYLLVAFDGKYFDETIEVFGSPVAYRDMAEAMNGYDKNEKRAIFAIPQNKPNYLDLLWLDGKYLDHPFNILENYNDGDDFKDDLQLNKMALNNHELESKLPKMLDEISKKLHNKNKGKNKDPLKLIKHDNMTTVKYNGKTIGYILFWNNKYTVYDFKHKLTGIPSPKSEDDAVSELKKFAGIE